jgi:tight adherence protein C
MDFDFGNLSLQSPAALVRQHAFAIMLGLIFMAAALTVVGSWILVTDRAAVKRRLQEAAAGSSGGGKQNVSLRFHESDMWLRALQPLYRTFLPKDTDFVSTARLKLIQAGYMGPAAVKTFYAVKVMIAIALGTTALILTPLGLRNINPLMVLPIAAVAMIIGYLAPAWYVDLRTAKRKRLIREGFPDALDLLLICVEAGLGLDAAIARVGSEIHKAHPILAEQLRMVSSELRAGRSRDEALRNLGERTGVEEVRTLVTLLVQSDELGTSIGQALRVHAFELRAKRLLTAEEKAHKIPVKLAFPLMFGLIPVVFIVTLTPAVIKFVTFIMPVLNRGLVVGGDG